MGACAEAEWEKECTKARNRVIELTAVIKRLGEILSEEYGSGETIYEEELNYLLTKKKLKKFNY